MKLLQLNAWGGRLDKQVANLLKDQAADIVCLQEAISTKGDGALAVTIEKLRDYADYPSVFHSPMFSFRLMNKNAHFGNTILSKLQFVDTSVVFTNLVYKSDFDFDSDDYNIRNFQHAIIDVGDKKLHVLNHHGHHVQQHKNGDSETLRQMNQIAEYIKPLEGPVILTGDFNLAPTSESIGILNDMLRNLSIEYGLETTRTLFTPKSEVCDFIFVNESVTVNEFAALDDLVSDHKALLLDFSI